MYLITRKGPRSIDFFKMVIKSLKVGDLMKNLARFFFLHIMWMRSNPDPAAVRLRRKTERLRRIAYGNIKQYYKSKCTKNKTIVSG